jgi:hypothetical protein
MSNSKQQSSSWGCIPHVLIGIIMILLGGLLSTIIYDFSPHLGVYSLIGIPLVPCGIYFIIKAISQDE